MGKLKEKQPETWKPSIVQNDSFISKNKKRKEKRMSKNLSIQKAETGDFIPVKKSALAAISKNVSNGFELSPKGKKGKAMLSTSLPLKGNTKPKAFKPNNSIASLKPATPAKLPSVSAGKQPKKVTGILSNPNTPKKNKQDRVTFKEDKPKAKKYIDDEAEEGEEPITSKEVKPYQKKGKQKVTVQMEDDSTDDSDDSGNSPTDFLDMEASEGEETDDESDGSEDDSDNDSDPDMSTFLADDDETDSEDDEGSDDEDEESEEDEIPVAKPVLPSKKTKPNQPAEKPGKKQKMVAEKPEPSKPIEAAKPNTPAKTKQEKAAEKKQKQSEEKMTAKSDKVKLEKQKPQKKDVIRPSDFVGFIRSFSSKLTVDVIKSKLSEKVDSSKILQVSVTKNRQNKRRHNAFVFLKDEESLDKLLNHKFDHETMQFTVYKAKSSQKSAPGKPVAFLPRVPIWITVEMLKSAIEAEIGPGKLVKIQDKKVSNKIQTRNVLVHVVDLETLKKLIFKGALQVGKEAVIVREAVEAGLQIPVYRAVFANIPQDMTEAVLKKAVEISVGKNTIESIHFSFRKKSFAFVTFNSAEALTKALALGDNVDIKGTKIRVMEFRQRKPKKRSTPSDEAKARKAEKRKLENSGKQKAQQQPAAKKAKQQNESSPGKGQQPGAKKPKQQNKSSPVETQQDESSPMKTDKKKRRRKPKKSVSPAPSGEVKAVKNPKKGEKKKVVQPEAAASKASPLKQKIEAKLADLKIQKKKKKAKKGKPESA